MQIHKHHQQPWHQGQGLLVAQCPHTVSPLLPSDSNRQLADPVRLTDPHIEPYL